MAEIERLTIALPAPMASRVRDAVAAGEYASASEVMRDALRLWDQRRELRDQDLERLRQAWDAGKASGDPRPLAIKELIAEERKALPGRGGGTHG